MKIKIFLFLFFLVLGITFLIDTINLYNDYPCEGCCKYSSFATEGTKRYYDIYGYRVLGFAVLGLGCLFISLLIIRNIATFKYKNDVNNGGD